MAVSTGFLFPGVAPLAVIKFYTLTVSQTKLYKTVAMTYRGLQKLFHVTLRKV